MLVVRTLLVRATSVVALVALDLRTHTAAASRRIKPFGRCSRGARVAPHQQTRRRHVVGSRDAACFSNAAAPSSAAVSSLEYEAVDVASSKLKEECKLRGTLFRAGPGDADGNGVMLAVTFDAGSVVARARFARTRAYFATQKAAAAAKEAAEPASSQKKKKSALSSFLEGPPPSSSSSSSTQSSLAPTCCYWAGKLFALHAGCPPYEMDPLSLGTRKRSDLGGQVEDRFEPWPRTACGSTSPGGSTAEKRFLNAKVVAGVPPLFPPALEVLEFDARFRLVDADRRRARVALDTSEEVLDWAASPTRLVALVRTSGSDDDDALALRVAPRGVPGGGPTTRTDLVLHETSVKNHRGGGDTSAAEETLVASSSRSRVLACRDAADGALVCDVLNGATLFRVRVAPDTGALAEPPRALATGLYDATFVSSPFVREEDADVSEGSLNDNYLAVVRDAGRGVALLSLGGDNDDDENLCSEVAAWTHPAPDAVIGRPTLAWRTSSEDSSSSSDDDEAFLVALASVGDRSDVVVFRADTLGDGPVAELTLPGGHLDAISAFDGPFVSDLVPSLDDVQNAQTLTRLYAKKSSEWNEIEAGFSGLGIKAFLFPKGVSGG